jgi:hypothetical protein
VECAKVRCSAISSLLVWLAVSCCASGAAEPTVAGARQRHPWGRFEVGAWKLVRMVTETLDAQGRVAATSTTQMKTTLKKIEDDGVTLQIEVVMEIGGRRLDAEPQAVKQGFRGELAGEAAQVTDGGPAKVTIEGREYPCRIEKIESRGTAANTQSQVYYSAAVAPYVLKSVSVRTDPVTGAVLGRTEWEVSCLDACWRLFRDLRRAAQVRSVQKHANGTTSTVSITSTDVPGEILYHQSTEVDLTGRPVRRSTLETVAYGLRPDDTRTGGVPRRLRAGHRHRGY